MVLGILSSVSLAVTREGIVYGITKPATSIPSGMAILGRKIYDGCGATLYEFEIPESKLQNEISEIFEASLLLSEEEVGFCN
jgi:hypothetical protein